MQILFRKHVNVETTNVLLLFAWFSFFYRSLNLVIILFVQGCHFLRYFRCFEVLNFFGKLKIVFINFLENRLSCDGAVGVSQLKFLFFRLVPILFNESILLKLFLRNVDYVVGGFCQTTT